jgi:hypothetical protein
MGSRVERRKLTNHSHILFYDEQEGGALVGACRVLSVPAATAAAAAAAAATAAVDKIIVAIVVGL